MTYKIIVINKKSWQRIKYSKKMKRREVMNLLLIFFALPVAVIIISIALQKILKCPVLVAAIIFAIFLIVTFVVNNLNFLIAAIAYAILSFITAYLTCIICRFIDRFSCNRCNRPCFCDNNNENNNNSNNGNILTLSNNTNNGNNCACNQLLENECTYQITNSDGLSARVSIVPNTVNCNNNCGCCRRR